MPPPRSWPSLSRSHCSAGLPVARRHRPRPSAATAPRHRAGRRGPAAAGRTVVAGLDIPWDVQRLPGGRLLITERDRARLSRDARRRRSTVGFPSGRVWVSGETGLMSLAVDPRFADNRRFYTCSGWVKPAAGTTSGSSPGGSATTGPRPPVEDPARRLPDQRPAATAAAGC